MNKPTLNFDTIVIGGGQAGLATGYFLKRQGVDFIILDANERIGDAWRNRWDSLRLFTPALFDGLPGMPFPAPAYYFPTKDEMADYLQSYAARFDLPVRKEMRVDRLSRVGDRYKLAVGDLNFEANNVVVAMSDWQKPKVPTFAKKLDPAIVQMHSSEYQNPSQLRDGGVLLVGAGNSGAEIAMDLAYERPTWLSGRDTAISRSASVA
jgi:putative flavoprotein involved in K+ transport